MPGITEIQLPGEQVDRQQGKHKPDFSAVRNNFKMVFDVIDVVFVCPTEVSRIKLLRGPYPTVFVVP